tara:strand:- start:232 stop:438 length:207 start_codon:yes stop_codon:yes gene_type:complete
MNKDWFKSKGFFYKEDHKWWQRIWRTHTPEGEERCLEVFKEDDTGQWTSIMYGNDGGIFYEHKINGIK